MATCPPTSRQAGPEYRPSMNILQAITSLDPASGGVAEAASLLHRDLGRMGHQVEMLCVDDPAAPWLAAGPQPCHAVGPGRASYQYSPGLCAWLGQHVGRFDAVFVHGLWQHTGFAVRSACRAAGIPYYVFPHGMLDPWFKRTYPLKHLKKWLYWPWGEYRVLRDAASVLFTCEEERRLAKESFWLYRCREKVAGFGIEEPPADGEAQGEAFFGRFPELQGKRFLLFLGRLHPKKGIEMLIKAFGLVAGNHRDVDLVIAGTPSGPGITEAYRSHLEDCARRDCPPGRVHFIGLLQGEAKWGAFRAAEALVLASHQENFGIAVVEALACRTPVLISRQVNIWREIEQQQAGMAEEDTDEGTLRLLESWLARPGAEHINYRARARQCFDRTFNIQRVSETILASLSEGAEGRYIR